MAAITIDQSSRFVSVLSFNLGSGDVTRISSEVRNAAETLVPDRKGFIGCVVMLNEGKTDVSVVSVWESADAWSTAQYDAEIGRVVTDIVETAKSYSVQTYETITVVRGS